MEAEQTSSGSMPEESAQASPDTQPEQKTPFQLFGGRQVETAALGKALSHAGLTNLVTGEPFSEPMLFGLGGGLGLGYFVYESGTFVSLFIGTRFMTSETPQSGFVHSICERLGIPTVLQTASSPGPAERKLIQSLDQKTPVIVWVDPRSLPYYGTPNAYHCFVVYGYEEAKGRFLISDRSSAPIVMTTGEVSAARQGEGAPKFRAITMESSLALADPLEAVWEAIRDFCAQMQDGFGPQNFRSNFGLKALQKWANLLVDKNDKRGWPKFFSAGERLFAAQISLFEQIENRSLEGMALRPLYADFLEEAAENLLNPNLAEIATQFRQSGVLWRALAEASLPDSVPMFVDTKNYLKKRKTIFENSGNSAIEEAHTADIRLAELRGLLKLSFPLQKNEIKDLLGHLHDQVLEIYEIESKAVASLQAVSKSE